MVNGAWCMVPSASCMMLMHDGAEVLMADGNGTGRVRARAKKINKKGK